MPDPRSIEVIVNAKSGGNSIPDLSERLAELFSEAGVQARISVARNFPQVAELARIAAKRSEVIVAAGGDGTVNAVASIVLEKNKILGVLPLGTLNHFAKDLNIPLDLSEGIKNIVAGWTIRVDVGTVNGQVFLNNSSLGLYPSI